MKIALKLVIISIFCLVSYTNQQLYAMDYTNPTQEKLICILSAVQTDMDYISKGTNPYRPSFTAQTGLSGLTPDLKKILSGKINDFNKQYNAAAFNPHNLAELQTEYLLMTSYLEELLKGTTPAVAKKATAPTSKMVPAKKAAAITAKKAVQSKKPTVLAKKHTTPVTASPAVKQANSVSRTVAHVQATAPKRETIIQKSYNGMPYTVCDWSEKVNKQTSATCAFHTVKNGLFMLEYLTGKIDKHTVENKLKAAPNSIDFPLAKWQNYIHRTDNLTEDELRRVAVHANFPTYNFTVIQNIRDFDPAHLWMNNAQFTRLCEVIAAVKERKPLVHVFALGTMTEFTHATSGLYSGANGHWISVVLHIDENKKVTLYTFDSASITGTTTQLLAQELAKLLTLDPSVLKTIRSME